MSCLVSDGNNKKNKKDKRGIKSRSELLKVSFFRTLLMLTIDG